MNFDTLVNRRGTHSYKWDSCPSDDVLPLWVADMDFQVAPCIVEALQRRAAHGIFGYVRVPDSYYEAVIKWFARRHNWLMKREWIVYTTGVVPAISAIIQALTKPGDKVLVQTPVYNCFFSSIRNNGCELVDSPLVYEQRTYRIDFEDLKKKAADPKVKVMLLCNPHNPAGRVWSEEELRKIADICLENNVFVISDEIHNELVMPGYKYTPFGTMGEKYMNSCAICTSPSKSFNIAGLQTSNITIPDSAIRQRVEKSININEVCDINPFGVEALQAAYSPCGEEWLNELLIYLKGNYDFLCAFFQEKLGQLSVTKLEGTYLVWVDCSALNMDSQVLEEELLNEAKVWFNAGNMYAPGGSPFIRINIACPREILKQALDSFAKYVNKRVEKSN